MSEPQSAAPTGPSPEAAEQSAEFQRRLVELTPRVYVTPALIALNVGVYLAMVARGVSGINPTADQLIAWGADYGPKTVSGEWWRLLTCCFVHIGIIHLGVNMWLLADAGALLERLLGHVGVAALYLASGVAGSIASVWWNPAEVSAGASGAIFGLCGALLSSLLLHRHSVPLAALARLRNSGVTFLAGNLVLGLIVPGVELTADIGGLVTGLLCGAVLGHRLTPQGPSRRLLRSVATAASAALLLGAAAWGLPRDVPDMREVVEEFFAANRAGMDACNDAIRKKERGKLKDAGLADAIEKDVLPEWRAQRERLEGLKHVPPKYQKLMTAFVEYMQTRQESWEHLVKAMRQDDRRQGALYQRKKAEADELLRRIPKLAKGLK